MRGFTEAESSCHRSLDLVLPRRTSKGQGQKELTRIKGSSMNRESQVRTPCRDAQCSTRVGNPGKCAQGQCFSCPMSDGDGLEEWKRCSAHSSRAALSRLGTSLGVPGRERVARFWGGERC